MKRIICCIVSVLYLLSLLLLPAVAESNGVSIRITNNGTVKAEAVGTLLEYANNFAEGDVLSISAPSGSYLEVTLDPKLSPAQVYLEKGIMEFPIPFGDVRTKQYGGAFEGSEHTISIKLLDQNAQKNTYRNLAINPLDFQRASEQTNPEAPTGQTVLSSPAVEKGEITYYPHAYANRVTRNLDILKPSNAINGQKKNTAHGLYPYVSWAGGRYDDLEYTIYFGREVTIDKAILYLRQDLNPDPSNNNVEHDTYWESGQIAFSNGTVFGIKMEKTAKPQTFTFPEQTVTWIRFKNLTRHSDAWASFTEVEVYGRDGGQKEVQKTTSLSANAVKAMAEKVNAYFMKTYPVGSDANLKMTPDPQYGWSHATYHAGNSEAFKTFQNIDFYQFSYEYGNYYKWLANNGTHTSDLNFYTIGQSYLSLYDLMPNNRKIDNLIEGLTATCIDKENARGFHAVDLSYMAMPTMAQLSRVTGDQRYNEAAHKMFLDINHWYDKNDHLWYRDDRFIYESGEFGKSPSGKKVFWSRGNAWAYVALAKTMANMSSANPYYAEYLQYFKDMSASLISRQQSDGFWYANLDDPSHYGGIETSGTVGFLYGLAWGINNGHLDFATYYPCLEKAWTALTEKAVSPEGRLLYVQPGGDRPYRFPNEEDAKNGTQPYAVGFFLLGSAELMKLCSDYQPIAPVSLPKDNIAKRPEIEEGYYKGSISASATSYQKTPTIEAKPENMFDSKMDEDPNSRWSAQTFPQSATIDFGKALTIRKITVVPHSARPYQYTIAVSKDGKNYTDIVDHTKDVEGAIFFDHDLQSPQTFRYLKLTVTGCSNVKTDWVSIKEIMVYEEKNEEEVSTPDPTEALPFTDVATDAWYYQSVASAFNQGLIKGMTETAFGPDELVNRAMFVTLLGRLAGIEPVSPSETGFADVSPSHYAAPYIQWAVENSLANGTAPETFAPDAPLTREQMAKLLMSYCQWKGIEAASDRGIVFEDAENISSWAKGAVTYCVSKGLMQGREESRFIPGGFTTRAEAAAVLTRLSQQK